MRAALLSPFWCGTETQRDETPFSGSHRKFVGVAVSAPQWQRQTSGCRVGSRDPEAGALGFRPACHSELPPTVPLLKLLLASELAHRETNVRNMAFLLSQTQRSPSAGHRRMSLTCTATPPSCLQPKVRRPGDSGARAPPRSPPRPPGRPTTPACGFQPASCCRCRFMGPWRPVRGSSEGQISLMVAFSPRLLPSPQCFTTMT